MRGHGLLGVAVIASAVSCGGDGTRCGDGTTNVMGVCLPSLQVVCGDGTKLENGHCVVDPSACQAGTVLIANRCVDPTRGLLIDLEESTEPNGLGIAPGVEISAVPAGVIALRPTGTAFVVHGHLQPFRDDDGDGQLDPDFDTYVLTVTAPTLLEVSVDGVGGAQGAFYASGDPQGAVPSYERYGLNLTGDTSQRRLFLPAAGRYALAIADTRTLAIGGNPPPPAGTGPGAGGPDAEYYASISVEVIPEPTVLTATAGVATHSGLLAIREVELFTAPMGTGTNEVDDVMPGDAAASLAVLDGGQLKGYADETPRSPSQLSVSGVLPGDIPLIVVDAAYNYGPAPEPFTLTIVQH